MKLTCPNCGAPISAQNINLHSMIAVCKYCDTVSALDAGGHFPVSGSYTPLDAPEGITTTALRDGGVVMQISLRKMNGLRAGVFLRLILIMLAVGALLLQNTNVFCGAVWGVTGVLGLYTWLITVLNHTTITLDEKHLKVTHEPVPWLTKDIALQDIKQVTMKPVRKQQDRVYLIAHTTKGKQISLDAYKTPYAEYIKQELERFLTIETFERDAHIQR